MAHTFRLRRALAEFIKLSIQSHLSGKNPTAPEGEYFRWRPLVQPLTNLSPEESEHWNYWNGGFVRDLMRGFDADKTIPLAEVLERFLMSRQDSANDSLSINFRLVFSAENTREFVAFLRTCGGFKVTEIIEE